MVSTYFKKRAPRLEVLAVLLVENFYSLQIVNQPTSLLNLEAVQEVILNEPETDKI